MEPPRHFLHSFSSSKGKQVNEATLHGDLAGPPTSPRGSFARGPTLAQRALGALEWRRGTSPEEQDAAGQRLLLLEDWAELHPAPGPGATPSPPRLQRPHHAHTDSESTPWAAGAPDYRASQSREGQGVGDAGRAPVRGGCRGPDRPSCWGLGRGLGRGTTWDRLQPSDGAPLSGRKHPSVAKGLQPDAVQNPISSCGLKSTFQVRCLTPDTRTLLNDFLWYLLVFNSSFALFDQCQKRTKVMHLKMQICMASFGVGALHAPPCCCTS